MIGTGTRVRHGFDRRATAGDARYQPATSASAAAASGGAVYAFGAHSARTLFFAQQPAALVVSEAAAVLLLAERCAVRDSWPDRLLLGPRTHGGRA